MHLQIKDYYKDVIGYLPNFSKNEISIKKYTAWSKCFLTQNCLKLMCETFHEAISKEGIIVV